jgi:hypothetical protein
MSFFSLNNHPMRVAPSSTPSPRLPRQRGGVLIEMTILMFVLLFAVGGVIQYGRLFWHYQAMFKAARDTARYLARSPGSESALKPTAPWSRSHARVSGLIADAGLDPAIAQDRNLGLVTKCIPFGCTVPGSTVNVHVDFDVNDDSWFSWYEDRFDRLHYRIIVPQPHGGTNHGN